MSFIERSRYRALYGPTTGDRIRLADTDLWIEVTEDRCVGGDEVVFGGGKVIRESMGQSTRHARRGHARPRDHRRRDPRPLGRRQGRHRRPRRPHRRHRQGRQPRHDGRRRPGARDRSVDRDHVRQRPDPHRRRRRLPRPPDLPAAPRRGARRRHHHDHRRRHRPGRGHQGDDGHAGAVAPRADARGARPLAGQRRPARQGQHRRRSESLWEQLRGGCRRVQAARGLGHDAGGDRRLPHASPTSPACRSPSTPTRSTRPATSRRTLAAIAGRSIHTYHTEGAGGGHAPDIITVASHPNVLPSSTNPTRPHTVNTVDEHLDMLMVCHHLNPAVPEDLAFAESRIRPSTIAAEDILHDLGAISMIGSDSQAMGRIGEVVIRTWQTAHVMKRAAAARSPRRRRRPTTTGPAATSPSTRSARRSPTASHGEVGSVEVGKLADLVLWDPAFFGVRPHVVVKGGMIAWATMGDANASIPTPAAGAAPADVRRRARRRARHCRVAWVAQAALDDGLRRPARACAGGSCRSPTPGRSARPTCRENDATARHRGSTPTRSPCAIDGELVTEAARRRAADGPALLPVLMPPMRLAASLMLLRRRAVPGGRPRLLGRRRGRGRDRRRRRRGDRWSATCTAGWPPPDGSTPRSRPRHVARTLDELRRDRRRPRRRVRRPRAVAVPRATTSRRLGRQLVVRAAPHAGRAPARRCGVGDARRTAPADRARRGRRRGGRSPADAAALAFHHLGAAVTSAARAPARPRPDRSSPRSRPAPAADRRRGGATTGAAWSTALAIGPARAPAGRSPRSSPSDHGGLDARLFVA